MWYLKVSSSLLIAVALICMIQNVISLTIDPKATEDQWSTLANSTDQNDLKKISKLCKVSLNNFNEKLENTKINANKKLPEPNKTTEDIANLVSDIKNQVKNASADLVNVRKLVQKTALRFRDSFKSLLSFTELDSESVNKELESIKKTTVDSKKPLVNRVIRSFGNRYDLNKLANNVLEVSSDREKLKNNYNEKKKIAKKEFNSLWNSLSNHSKTVNDNALKALDTFFEGMKSVKSVKKKVKALGEDALDKIKVEDDIIKLKNAVELAKALKLKFEDEWNLDSGELTYSEEQKKPNTKITDDDQSDVQEKEEDKSNENIPTNDLEPDLPSTEQVPIENDKSNVIPPTQAEIEELPIMDNRQTSDKVVSATEETQLPLDRKNKDVTKIIQPTISEKEHNVSDAIDSPVEDNPSILNTENKDKTAMIKPQVLNNYQNSTDDDDSNSDSSIKQTSFNPDINNTEVLNTPPKDSIDDKRINKITSRDKNLILPWEKLIQLDNLRVSQQSMKCKNLLNNVKPDFDNIKKAAKNSIQVTKSYKNLQNIENYTVKQFYDKMVDTNTKLCDYLVNAVDDVCAKVTPINKRYETKFKNDPNIKRIKYLLGKQYDPNQYILKVLDDANHKNGIGGMKKTTYYKMLAVAHNLNHETKEMENAALYAMNKIHEGKLAATNLQTNFNKEKASKACYIRNILLEKENEDEKKNKEENKEKIKESINEDTNTEPLKPDVNLDSVDAIQPSKVNDDNEPIINDGEDTKTLSEPNEFTDLNNQKENADETNIEDSKNKKGSMGQGTQEPNESSSIPQDKGNDINTNIDKYENNKAKRNITRKITHHRKHRNPNDPNEEYETSEEEDDINSNKSGEKKSNEVPETEVLNNADNEHDTETPEHLETEKAASDEENDEGINKSIKPKVKRYRKRIDPKDGKEITEEYETSEEEDDINSNKSGEKKSNEVPESEVLNNADNEHDTETPEHLETEKAASDEENDEGINKSIKPKVKRYRKRIDPKDGKEITEEYETSEEEDDINSNKSGEKKSNEVPETEVLNNTDNEHDTETPEHLETEKAASDEENDEGINKSIKPKVKRYRKRIDPKDGKEITEEYETSEEEDDINSNKSGEKKSNEDPESEVLNNTDNEHDTETPEHLETEKAASDEENDEGINKSIKPKVKRYRKRIDPKDGKEITEEYETSEEEDDINSNKSGEKKSNEVPESEVLNNTDNEHDTETPEHLETENAESDEENDEGINKSIKPKVKRYRKRIDPKDGKEITEEYETSEEEDDINSNKSGEKKSNEVPESEVLNNADNEHDTETPEHLETEKAASDEENDEGINKSIKPKVKRYRKRIDPKDGKEITEEYETSEEEDDINSNKSGEKKSNEVPESEVLNNADNEHDTETPEHLETEKAASDEENDEGINKSIKPKVKRYRKRIDPKDGKEITEEYETSKEEDDINSNKSGEKKSNEVPESEVLNNADNEHDTETPEHLETEKAASDEENDEGINKSIKPKVKRYRKRIDPKDGKEITEEYETSEEEDDINSNKSGEKKSNEDPESEVLNNTDNEHDTETPEHLETEKAASDEENDEGINKSIKPKVKRYRKRIDPKDGKEITEEYETSEEEDDINSNKSGEKKSNEVPESEVLNNTDNEHDTETPEHLETEKAASDEENDEGINKSIKPKVKRYRKRIDPKDGKEITEEYETSEEEDDINSNKSGEKKSNEVPESEVLNNTDNKHDTETPEHLETEKAASDEENDEGINKSIKPKVKRYRKRIDPKDGKEITEEYETSEEEDDINSNKSGEKKSNEVPESEVLNNTDNEHDTETPEHLETEKAASDEENDEGINKSIKPKVKRYRKRIDPKDGKEITEEYETSEEEDDINSNKSNEIKPNEAPESELLGNADNEHDTETPEHLKTEKAASDEEENENKSNEKVVNDTEEVLNPDLSNNYDDALDKMNDENNGNDKENEFGIQGESKKKRGNQNKKRNSTKNEYDIDDDLEHTHDNSREFKPSEDNVADKNPENITRESVELDDNENLNSVEGAELKSIYNDNIIPAADSMGEDSSSVESSNEEPNINDSNNNPKNNNEQYNSDDQPNKISKGHRKRKEHEDISENEEISENDETPDHNQANEHELIEENEPEKTSSEDINKSNDTNEQNDGGSQPNKKMRRHRKRRGPKDGQEVSEEDGPVSSKNIDTPTGEPDGELTDDESETPEHEDISENEEISENDETPDHNQANEHELIEENEPEKTSSEDINKSNDTNEQNDGGSQPNKKMRRHRKRRGPKDGQDVSEEASPVSSKNIDTPTGEPDGELTDHESETPEYDGFPENGEILENGETPEHNQANEHELIEENEPEKTSSEDINKSNETNEQNDGGSQPNKKMRRHRKRRGPKDGQDVSEEASPVSSKNIDTPTGEPDGELTDHESETPEHEDISENEEISENDETPDHNQANEHELIDENEPEKTSSEDINKSNDTNEQNDGGSQPNKKMRRHRKRRGPKDGQDVSEEDGPVSSKNIDTPTGEPDGELTDQEPETPEHEDISENEEISENDETPDHNQANEHELIDENEPEKTSSEDINKSNDTNEQNDGGSQPNKKMRRHRKRRGPKDGQDVSEEDGPVSSKNIDTPTGEPDGELTDQEPETPEHEDISENEEISENDETPDHNQANEHELIDENEPEKTSSEDINKSNDTNEQNDGGSQPNKKMRRHRKRRGPKDGQEVSEEDGPVSSKNIDTPTGEPDGELTDHESETPEHEDISENEEISENDETPDHNQANEHELIDENEPEKTSSEDINKSNDTNEQNDGGSQPNKKMRRHRKRRGPKDGQEVSEEDGPVSSKNIDTPTGEPDGELTDHESEKPEHEDISENEEISENDETPDHNQANEHELIDENEPEKTSSEDINKSNDTNEQNDGGSQPNKKMRRHRKRRGPKDGQEVSEEDGPVSSKNIDTPTGEPDGELTDHESETPEHEDISENEEISENDETPDHNQANEHELIDENEPEKTSSEDINKSNDTNEQNDGGSQPNKKMRRHRKIRGPKDGQDVSEEDGPVSSKNIDTPTGEPDGELTDQEPETPEHEDISENEEISENDETPDHNQANEHELIDENEPEKTSSEDINKSNDTNEQNDGGSQPNKKMRRHRKRRGPKDGQEVSEDYDPEEEQEDHSPVVGKNIGNSEGESIDHPTTDYELETPEYDGFPENGEIPENGETPEYSQSNTEMDEHEPERSSNEAMNKSIDIKKQNYQGNHPNKKMRRLRKRKDPNYDQEVSKENDTVKEQEDKPPVLDENYNLLPGEPEYKTELESDTPKNDEIPEDNQSNEHAEILEFEPDRKSNEEKDIPKEIAEQNNADNQPNKKIRRRRKRKDPLHSHEISEEYETIEDEDDEKNKLETPNIVSYDQFDNQISSPNNENNANDENNLVNPPKHKPKRSRNRKNSEYDHEMSEEYDSFEEYDEEAELKKNTFRPEINNENRDFNNNVIPNIEENNEAETESSEYPENAVPVASSTNNFDKTMNVAKPLQRQVRCHRKSRQPDSVIENHNEPVLVTGENMENYPLGDQRINDGRIPYDNNQEELPKIRSSEVTNIDNEIEQPELSEYPENSDVEPEVSSPNDVDETINVVKPRPRKLRRHRKSRQPKTLNENENEPEVVKDDNNVQEELPETGNGETTDINNEMEQPELSEYPENSNVEPEVSSPNDVNETINVAKPRPRKLRCHRKSRNPKSLNENDNEPEVVNDYNNVQEELPETGNGETTDINNEMEQPELSEYPENSNVEPEVSSPNDVDETINVVKPRPRKLRRHRKSRIPKSLNENENEPEVVNDYNNVQEELPETGNGETTDINNEMEQPELSEYPENSNVEPEVSSPNDVDETINVVKPRPRKLRRHRKSRIPKSLNENENEPEVVNDYNNVQEELPETGNGETTDINNEMEQPELSEYPENSNVEPEVSSPNDVDETINVVKPRPRKLRRHRKSRQPKTLNENENEPEVVKDDNNVQEELPETGNGETTDINNEMEQPELSEYPENSNVEPEVSSPNDVNETINVAKPRPRKLRCHRKSRQPKTVNENYNETEDPKRIPTQNNEHVNYEKDPGDNEKTANLNDTDGTMNSKQPRRKKHVRRKKIPTTEDEITPNSLDTENRSIQNDVKSVENSETQPNDTGRNQKKKRRLRRIRTYMVNKATNERIPINDQTYSTTDGLPDTPKNKLEATEIKDFDDPDSNEDNDDYSSFLFKEYNSDQCKRDAYDRFKKVTSQDAKQIAYRSVLDTSEMRSNMLATLKNAIGNVKVSKTLNDVDQSLRTVSYSLKTGLKQTVSDLVTKVIPLAKDFLKTAENLKELYKNGPQSTHKMISNILENESTVPDSAKDILKLISPQFDVDELINNIFEKPFNTKSLKEKKAKAQRKLIGLSKHMDTAISNIDCFVLSAMSAVGIGADTLKLLKSGRVIMSDKHPRSKALRDAVGIIKSGKKIRNNDVGFAPTLTPPDGFNESDEDDDDEDPDQVAQKNEEFLKTVPDLDDNIPVPKKVPNRRQSLGVIVVHPDKQIEYKEVTDTSQLKKFVGDQTKKYKLQSKNKHPKFLKLNSKKLIDSMVMDVKKKAERNGMSKKEMVEEIIKNLNSS